ncbi:transglycosylase SLT domain-containing protein [Bartonella sp. TP]|uniref:lytic transglycosylase domain-containing protein n=1 Tax=Bartonella sp. TP TaxID=3057550 RepID=UPI0025B0FB2C|nr:transglycosylase SLT domain-containing protein [Bartonella sp. TP]WJW79753.1 transglycosylase SLT domain-containing protein [Bartonella sp. TP]
MNIKSLISTAVVAAVSLTSFQMNAANAFSVAKDTNKVVTTPRPFDSLINKLAKEDHVQVNLVHAVIHTESNYNVDAHGSAGEVGLMQLMPTTARSLGFHGPLTDLYNPETNLKYGVRYLAKAEKLGHGETCTTILKYNAGYGAKKMNPISQRYCEKVRTYLASLK